MMATESLQTTTIECRRARSRCVESTAAVSVSERDFLETTSTVFEVECQRNSGSIQAESIITEVAMRWLVLAAMVFAGCSQNPQRGDVEYVTLRGDYRTAAQCAYRRLENTPGMKTTLEWRDEQRHAEVSSKGLGSTLWSVDIGDLPSGSIGAAYVSNEVIYSGRAREALRKAIKPCVSD
jgi:hypothetical protein